MEVTSFDYQLPQELIAQNPAKCRDQARLLVYDRATKLIRHHLVADLPDLLPTNTTVVVNNSKVKSARLAAVKPDNQKIYELLCIEDLSPQLKRCLIRGKALKPGSKLLLITPTHPLGDPAWEVTVTNQETVPGMETFLVSFPVQIDQYMEEYGTLPLPPYIKTSTAPKERYQTVYAKPLGSAAAPTAGLHFTPSLIKRLAQANHKQLEITLHVGIGTFMPLRENLVEANRLHPELTEITPQVAEHLSEVIQLSKPLLAVGTTSLRTLEGHYHQGKIQAGSKQIDLFLYPGAKIHTANLLLTNFHLPKSSLLMLVAAFLGNQPNRQAPLQSKQAMIADLHRIYQVAIDERYRFFSFGDAMLIL